MPDPAADHAEREFLGVLLHAHPDAAEQAAGVTEGDFRIDAHRHIWRAISALWDAGRPATLDRVATWLMRKAWLDDAGGGVYLATLFEESPSGSGVRYYADAVREHALRRRLADEGRRLTQLAEERGVPAAELLADMRARLAGLGG